MRKSTISPGTPVNLRSSALIVHVDIYAIDDQAHPCDRLQVVVRRIVDEHEDRDQPRPDHLQPCNRIRKPDEPVMTEKEQEVQYGNERLGDIRGHRPDHRVEPLYFEEVVDDRPGESDEYDDRLEARPEGFNRDLGRTRSEERR